MSNLNQSRKFRNRRSLRLAAAASSAGLAGIFLHSAPVLAQNNYTWSSGNSAYFSTGFDGSPTVSSDPTNQFNFSSGISMGSYTATNDLVPLQVNTISISNANASTTTTIASLNGNPLIFNGSGPQLNLISGNANITSQITSVLGMNINNSGAGNLTLNSQILPSGVATTITNSGSGEIIMADSGLVAYYGTNVLLNLANTGTGQFLLGDLGPTSMVLNSGVGGILNISAGTVTASNTGGDLFGETLVLNVAQGATFNFNNNGESFGGFSGSGTIVLGSANMYVDEPGNQNFNGSISGTGPIKLNNGSILTLGVGGTLSYSGLTTVTASSTLNVTGADVLSPNGPVNVFDGFINLNGYNQSIPGLSGGNLAGTLNLGASTLNLNPSGGVYSFNTALTGTGNIIISGTGIQALLGSNTYTGSTNVSSGILRMNPAGLQTSGISVATGAVFDALVPANASWSGTPLTGTGGFYKEGAGTLTFSSPVGLNASILAAAAGTIILDQTTYNTPMLGASPALVLAGGNLSLLGNAGAASGQTFAGLTLGSGNGSAGSISVTSGSNQNANISLGSITRNIGSTVDFNTVNTGTGAASILTTAVNTSGIIGGYATFNQSNWATVSGGNIVPLGSYNSSFSSGYNTAISTSTKLGVSSSTTTSNSLLMTGTGSITFNASSNILLLQSGGILVPPTVNVATTIGATGFVGKLEATSNDVIFNDYATQPITVVSIIANNSSTGTSVTKSGTGTLILAGTNTYTGATYINGGTLQIVGTVDLGAAANPVYINGGTLSVPNGSVAGTIESTAHPFTIGPAGATFNFNSATAVAFQGNGLSGTGTIVSNGSDLWSVGSNASSFSGNIILNAGVLEETSNQLASATGLAVNSGAQYWIKDNGAAIFGFSGGAPVTLAGVGPTGASQPGPGPGAFVESVQSPGPGPVTTFSNPIVFTADASIGVYSTAYSGVTYFPSLTFSGAITGPGNLIKLGNGYLTLSNASNTYGGANSLTEISAGTLLNGASNALPINTTLQFGTPGSTSSAIYDLNGFNQTVAGLTVVSGTGHQIINSQTSGSTLTVNYNGSTPQTFNQQIGGGTPGSPVSNNISLIKAGTGTLTLSGTTTFSGPVTVSAGSLRIVGNGSNMATRSYTVADGAGLIVNQPDPTQALPMTSLTLGNTGTTNLSFELDGAPSTQAGAIAVSGTNGLTLNGNINVAVSTTAPLYTGIYQLISYSGSIGGTGFSALNQSLILPNRVTASLIEDPSGNAIDLDVTYVDYLKWSGATNGNWDINTTPNWSLNSNGSAQTYQESPAADAVVFDDTAVGTHTVNLTTTLNPASVSVNTASSYTFSGIGSINGSTGLSMSGTGTLNILTSNTYTGQTIINSGTMTVGNGGTIGSLGSGTITNNGTLNFNRSDNVTVNSTITGSGLLTQSGVGTLTLAGAINLTGNVAIPAGTLSVADGGTVTGDITGPGTLNIAYGPLQIGNGGTTGTVQTNVTFTSVNSSIGTLVFDRSDSVYNSENITGNGNLTVLDGSVTLTGTLSYTGTTAIGSNTLEIGSNSDTTLPGLITGTGTLIKSGTGQLTILASNKNFTGTLIVNGGNVLLEDNGTGGDLYATSILINNGGRFIFGEGGIPGENPNFPTTTFITIYTGGVYESRIGEDWGATSLQGGEFLLNGGSANFQALSGPFLGFDLQSGSVVAETANSITSANTGGGLIKTTAGVVTFSGPVSIGTTTPIYLNEGTLNFQGANIPSTGTAQISMGGSSIPAVLELSDAGTGKIIRPINLNTNSSFYLPAVNGATGSLTISGIISGSGDFTETGAGTITLSGSNNYSGNTNISGGNLVLATTGYIGNSPNILLASGSTFSLATSTSNTTSGILTKTLGNLNVSAGALVIASSANNDLNRLLIVPSSISLAGTTGNWLSKIDLGTNDLDVPNGNLAVITNQVKQGFNSGAWNGSGITSTSAAGNTSHLTALGVIQNSLDQTTSGAALYGNATPFDGQTPSNTDVLVKYTYYGDANLDGKVDGSDYSLIDNGYLNHLTGWYNGDFNYDATVDGSDYTLIDNAFNSQGTQISAEIASPTAQIAGASSSVPEPATLGLLVIGAMGLLGRRRRV